MPTDKEIEVAAKTIEDEIANLNQAHALRAAKAALEAAEQAREEV